MSAATAPAVPQHLFPHINRCSLTHTPVRLVWGSERIITSTFSNERMKSSGNSPWRARGSRAESGAEPGSEPWARLGAAAPTHTLQENVSLPGANNNPTFNRPLTGALQSLLYSWALGLLQKTHLLLQMIRHYHQHQRRCLNVPPKLARGQNVTSASPNWALYDTALDDSWCQYSWLLFLLGKPSSLALKYCILQ